MRFILSIVLLAWLGTAMGNEDDSRRDSLYRSVQELEDSARLEKYFDYAMLTGNAEEIRFWYDQIKSESTLDTVYWNAKGLQLLASIHNFQGEFKKDIELRWKAIEKFNTAGYPGNAARQYVNIGNAFSSMAMNDSAEYYYRKGIELAKEYDEPRVIAAAYVNLSTVFNYRGEKQKELEYLIKTVDLAREHEIKDVLANALFNLSVHYAYEMEFEKAEELCKELSYIYKSSGNLLGMALLNNVRAKLMFDQQKPNEALNYLDSAMQIYQGMGYKLKMAAISMNIGQVHGELNHYEEALDYLTKAQEVFYELQDYEYISTTLHDMALIFYEQGDKDKAIRYLRKAVAISDSIKNLDNQLFFTRELANVFHDIGINDSAYQRMLAYSNIKDSLHEKNKLEAISKMEAEYQNERKQLEIENLQNEKLLQEAEIRKQQSQNRLLYGGLGAALLLIIIVSFAFFQKKKDNAMINAQKSQLEEKNEELNLQKEIVEEKNREITDSINYASKIQEAVLPPLSQIQSHLPDSFIFYLPKDIVAGDFYWFDRIDGKKLIAAADCTGHGVPGAMVSVVCSNALNRCVREFKLSKPAEILNKCQELVAESLGDSSADVKDGMDISLCAIDEGESKIEFAGAYNPLWVIGERPKTESELLEFNSEERGQTLYEIKADKQAIGNHDHFQPFTNHQLKVPKNSYLYLFSDGFFDQFGGKEGKKLKSRNLKKILLSLYDLNIPQQGAELASIFEKWKGNLEQLDDVCIIGIKV